MPKERITYPTRYMSSEQPGEPQSVTDPSLSVNWLNQAEGGGHVQLSLEVHESYLRLALESLNGDSPDTSYVWTPVLSRHDLNRLIKTLRRARDGAYGADA